MEDTNGTAGETASPETEYVSVEEADDADLSAYLKNAKAERESSLYEDETDEEDDSEEESEEESEPKSDEPSDETEAKKPELNGKDKDAEIERLRAEKEEIKKKALEDRKQRETYIQRLKFQLGEARKTKGEEYRQLAAKYQEQVDINPAEAIDTKLELRRLESELSEIDQYESQADEIHQNRTIFEANVDPSEVNMDEIVASFEREGLPPNVIQNIKSAPFASMRAETLIQAHHKVKAQRVVLHLVDAYKKLQAEYEQLKKGSKTKSVEHSLKKISQAAKQMPRITGARGGGSSTADLAELDVDNMSDAELKELSKKLRGR